MTGATGVTGPTAPNVTSNYLHTFNPGSQTVFLNGAMNLGPITTSNGAAIQQINPTTITLAANQTYQISYSVCGLPETATSGALTLAAAFSLNGSNLNDTHQIAYTTNINSQVCVSDTSIISTAQLSTLQLVNSNNATSADGATYFRPAVSVVKLA